MLVRVSSRENHCFLDKTKAQQNQGAPKKTPRLWPERDGYPETEEKDTNQGAAHPRLRWNAQERCCCSLVAKELLTVNAVADELKVSRSTVYRLIAARELHTVQVRGCRRVSRTALDRYITGLERSARLADVVISYDE